MMISALPKSDTEIDILRREQEQAKQRRFLEHLLASGVISHIPERRSEDELHRYKPITVIGEPVSETIIRERR